MDFNVCIIQPKNYVHSSAFLELAELVCFSLRDLGHRAKVSLNRAEENCQNVMIGCHLLDPKHITRTPETTVVLNTEQIHSDQTSWNPKIFEWARRFPVWDYSERNIEKFHSLGIEGVKHLRLGYQQQLARIEKAPEQDIDVLFYGSVNERRRDAILAIRERGLNIQHVFGVYGPDRDTLVARSKLVLNLHLYKSQIFEIVRCFYLMTNSVAVVSEVGPNTSIDPIYLDGLQTSTYEGLAEACAALVADEARRRKLEADAFAAISTLPQSRFTAAVLDAPADGGAA